MNRLLSANLMRLCRSKLFWGLTAVMGVIPIAVIFERLIFAENQTIDGIALIYPVIIGIAIPIFISIFIGTEYSEGTIRNKLIIGHSRSIVYLANLITTVAAAFVMFVAYFIPIIVLGFSVFGVPIMSGAEFVKILLVSMVTIVAFCAMHTMVSMIYCNKAGASVINLLLAFLMFAVALILLTKLNSPEFLPYMDINGSIVYSPNPSYITGGTRYFCQSIIDILPMGQAAQIMLIGGGSLWVWALCSVGVTAACTSVGIAVLRKKNIK